jgi:membrane dipeptidase
LFAFSHNDLAWNIRKFLHNQLGKFNFSEDLRQVEPWSKSNWSHTDLPRMKAGLIGAQVGLYVSFQSVENKI